MVLPGTQKQVSEDPSFLWEETHLTFVDPWLDVGTSYVSLLWGYPHYEYDETNKPSLDLHWSQLFTVRKGLNHRSASTNFQSIFFTLQRIEFSSHFFWVSTPIKAFLLYPRHPNTWSESIWPLKIIPPPKHPQNHLLPGSYIFEDVFRVSEGVFSQNPRHVSPRFPRQERSGSESSFVTSLAGSLPKVRPRDVLTGRALTGRVGFPWTPMGWRRFYPWMWEKRGLDFFWGRGDDAFLFWVGGGRLLLV